MNIGWLWHFTQADNPDWMPLQNADRAAAIYSRWRRLHRPVEELAWQLRTSWRAWRRERTAHRELHALSDHLLHDLGLQRHADGTVESSSQHRWSDMHRSADSVRQTPRKDRVKPPRLRSISGERSKPVSLAEVVRCNTSQLPSSARQQDQQANPTETDAEFIRRHSLHLPLPDTEVARRVAQEVPSCRP